MIQSNTVTINVKVDTKTDGNTYKMTQKVTFPKAFNNTPVITLAVNGFNQVFYASTGDNNPLGFIKNITTNVINGAPTGFAIEINFLTAKVFIPGTQTPFSITVDQPSLFQITWTAYDEVTIGS